MSNAEVKAKEPSRFNLFVKLKPGVPSTFPKQKRVFCYVGNAFTDEHHKQLKNLIKLANKNFDKYWIIEIYDQQFDKNDDRRYIFKFNDGEVSGHMAKYQEYLTGFVIPDFIKAAM